ncbi:MAG: competence/damage-inducible protein A [Elusimicrobia bacterium]|nr:competence/damage-inducible protein A [Elusimicrobiota bacterium]
MAAKPRAEIVCVGTELLAGKVNTHGAYLARRLKEAGFDVPRETTVADSPREICEAVSSSAARADAVVVCGGLGPTFDDVTREGAAAACGRALRYRPSIYACIRRKYGSCGMRVPKENRRQAWILSGARVLANERGSAPGQLLARRGRVIALLPGPFLELEPMFEGQVLPELRKRFARRLFQRSTVFRFCGIAEAAADQRLRPLLAKPPAWAEYTILAGPGQVELRASVTAPSARLAEARLKGIRGKVERLLKTHLCGIGEGSIESAVGERLTALGWKLAVAESCTGGLLSAKITSVPGSSGWFLGGAVAYGNAVKVSELGVRPGTLAEAGAVSAACAREMAEGIRRRLSADAALSITGSAGPGGGARSKPVGLVYIGLALPGFISARRYRFPGEREQVRKRAVVAALWRLLQKLNLTVLSVK